MKVIPQLLGQGALEPLFQSPGHGSEPPFQCVWIWLRKIQQSSLHPPSLLPIEQIAHQVLPAETPFDASNAVGVLLLSMIPSPAKCVSWD